MPVGPTSNRPVARPRPKRAKPAVPATAAKGGAVLSRGTFQPSNRKQQAELSQGVRQNAAEQARERRQIRMHAKALQLYASGNRKAAIKLNGVAGLGTAKPGVLGKVVENIGTNLVGDAYHAPGGVYALGKAGVEDTKAAQNGDASFKHSRALGAEIAKQTATSLEHPLRRPGDTLLNLGAVASLGAGAAAKLGAAGEATRAGELGTAAKALVKRPPVRPRLIRQGELDVSLPPSGNQAFRAAQGVHDAVIRRALAKNPEGRVASYATKRLGGSLDETRRYRASMQSAPARAVEHGGKKIGRVEQAALRLTSEQSTPEEAIALHERQLAKGVNVKEQRRQLKLLGAVRDRGLVTLDESRPAGERVHINAKVHPKLAKLDAQLAKGSTERDAILARTGQMPEGGLQERIDAPGKIRAGGKHVKTKAQKGRVAQIREYPGKLTTTSRPRTHAEAEARLAEIDKANEYIVAQLRDQPGGLRAFQAGRNMRARPGRSGPTVTQQLEQHATQRLSDFLEHNPENPVAKAYLAREAEGNRLREQLGASEDIFAKGHVAHADYGDVTKTEAGKPRRVNLPAVEARKASARIVGEGARPGRNYVPYYQTEKRVPGGSTASAASPVVGKAQGLVPKTKTFTGAALEHGHVPPNTTGLVARQMQRAYRYANTDEFRRTIATAGAQTRQTSRDVLVNTQELKNAKVPDTLRAELGGGTLTLDELSGHAQAFDAWRQHLLPGIADKFKAERGVAVGTEAPKGYRWVDQNLLGELGHAAVGPPGRIARTADTVNSAVTAATVYYKLGHIATRAGTNFVANVIQGSAHPLQLARSVKLWKSLAPTDRLRALGAAGEGGIHALPHEGTNAIAAVARGGSQWWSKHVDAPFRFNSLVYEARKAGYQGRPDFLRLLDEMQNPAGLSAKEAARVDRIAKRANREAIAYDRLNETEKRFLRRGVWFYPWISGSTRFAANTILEHPIKAAALGNLGQVGQSRQAQELGALPDYEQGLFKTGGSKALPRVMDVGTISPFGTPAEVTRAALHFNRPAETDQLSRFLNPSLAAAARAAFHLDAYGRPSTDTTLHNILSGFGATTPEATLLHSFKNAGQDQSKRMFQANKRDAIKRFLGGSEMPRTLNRPVANADARKDALAAMAPLDRTRSEFHAKRAEYLTAAKKAGLLPADAQHQPAEVRKAFALRESRLLAYKKAGHALDQRERFTIDQQLLLARKAITPAQAAKGEAWAKTASDKDISSFRRELGDQFFGTETLSGATRQINDHGGSVSLR